MSNDIMVSVIIATYNHENYIEQAINSVLMQKTTFKYEVLIGEDFSPDGTAQVLKKIEPKLPDCFRILFRNKNYGAVNNCNDLYSRAKGKYIILLEGDDYWTYEYKLQKQVDFLEAHSDFVAVAHNTEVVDKNSNIRTDYDYPECKKDEYTVYDYGKGILMGQTATILYRNYFKSNLFKDIPVSVRYPGDRRKNFLLVTHGRVKCFQEKWSAYRYVNDEGTSFSANVKHDKTLSQRELVFYRDLKKYADNELCAIEPKIVIQNLYLMCGLSTCIYKRNPNYSWKDWVKEFGEAKYKGSFIKYFIMRLNMKVFGHSE